MSSRWPGVFKAGPAQGPRQRCLLYACQPSRKEDYLSLLGSVNYTDDVEGPLERHFRRDWSDTFVTHRLVHHLADVEEASTTFRIHFLTLAATSFFLVQNAFYDGRSSIIKNITLNISRTVAEAVTN